MCVLNVKIKEKTVNVSLECDVLVAGGGVAGIAAALAAARRGAEVVLLEKQCLLGGLATLGLITVYLPLCDGMGNQVIFGIGEELLKLSIKYGHEAKYPFAWLENGTIEERKKQRYAVRYNAQMFAILAEQLLLSEGVKIYYDTKAIDAVVNGGRIEYIITDSKSGQGAIKANVFVDCTGDADICAFAGETVDFYRKNRFAVWYYHSTPDGYKLQVTAVPHGKADLPKGERFYDLFKPEDVNEMIIRSHQKVLEDVLEKRKTYENDNIMPVTVPTIPLFRMTRRLCGAYTLDEKEVFTRFHDCVGRTGDWRKPGPVFDIPFRILYGNKISNLFVAGRCVSVTEDMWDITRVIPTCAVTGEAAGVAAALCSQGGIKSHELKAEEVRQFITLG
jgi:hypothetical protein